MALISVPKSQCADVRTDYVMYSDPVLHKRGTTMRLSDRSAALWREALSHPEADFRRQAADTIAAAYSEGFKKVGAARLDLERLVADERTDPLVLHAAAHALIVLEVRDAAPALFAASQRGGMVLRQLIEPALADWAFEPIRPVWRARLEDQDVGRQDLLLALAGLAAERDEPSLSSLLRFVNDVFVPGDIRLAAAHAAGTITGSGMEQEAQRLLNRTNGTLVDRLCAVRLLERHDSDIARAMLASLSRDDEPAVAAAALQRLFAIDPALVAPLAEAALLSRDANVRLIGVAAYAALPDPQRVTILARLLDDPHPAVRSRVRTDFVALAQRQEFTQLIPAVAMDRLAGDNWRGQEQAAILLGTLDHKPAAPRLVELLESTSPGVMVASAWSLRKLAVPETLPAILDRATRQTAVCRQIALPPVEMHRQLAHLHEVLGLMNYAPAEPLLRQYIPKNFQLGDVSRAAAVWSLGLLHAGEPDETLTAALVDRLNDVGSLVAESNLVRQMAAVTLARTRAIDALPDLQVMVSDTTIESATRWAVEQLTGEQLPPLEPTVQYRRRSFLEPLEVESEPTAE